MNKKDIALILNIIIIFLELVGFIFAISSLGTTTLLYYTQDSNLLLLIISAIYTYYLIQGRNNIKFKMPRIVKSIKYMATVSVIITFVVVVTILSWTMTISLFDLLFSGSMLFHHTLCPILAAVAFIFFEDYDLDKNEPLKALSFTIIYGVIMIILNIARLVKGPYPFLMVRNQSTITTLLWLFILLGGAYVLAYILKAANEKFKDGKSSEKKFIR